MAKLERKVGSEGRKIFERFLAQVARLQEKQQLDILREQVEEEENSGDPEEGDPEDGVKNSGVIRRRSSVSSPLLWTCYGYWLGRRYSDINSLDLDI
jgi:hypothetical protein